MLTLHHLNDSRSQRILWLLEELGVPYEMRRYQRKLWLAGAKFAAIESRRSESQSHGRLSETDASLRALADPRPPPLGCGISIR